MKIPREMDMAIREVLKTAPAEELAAQFHMLMCIGLEFPKQAGRAADQFVSDNPELALLCDGFTSRFEAARRVAREIIAAEN